METTWELGLLIIGYHLGLSVIMKGFGLTGEVVKLRGSLLFLYVGLVMM